jgi:hypothetical protein
MTIIITFLLGVVSGAFLAYHLADVATLRRKADELAAVQSHHGGAPHADVKED